MIVMEDIMRKILIIITITVFSLLIYGMNETKKDVEKPEIGLDKKSGKAEITKKAEKETEEIVISLPENKSPEEKTEIEDLKVYQTGIASFYGGKWHGRKTANGEIFDTYSLTAAHKTLPFNTKVKVTNLNNGKSVIVRINNRGPYAKGRVIDLSTAAFSAIESTNKGITRVQLQIVK